MHCIGCRHSTITHDKNNIICICKLNDEDITKCIYTSRCEKFEWELGDKAHDDETYQRRLKIIEAKKKNRIKNKAKARKFRKYLKEKVK